MPESTQGQSQGGQQGAQDKTTNVEDDIRQAAERHGIDLANVKGTGPNGKITMGDVEAARVARNV